MDNAGEFLHPDYCKGVMETFLHVFVIVKALLITFFSVQGIGWFLKNKFTSFGVISVLVISIALVSTTPTRKAICKKDRK